MAKEYGDVGYEEAIYFGLHDAYQNIQKTAEQDIKKSNDDIARFQAQLDQLKDKATDRDRQNLADAQQRLARAQRSKENATGQPDAVLKELMERYPNSSAAQRAKRTLGL
jgi:predicted phage gp36 major capsid-like protein